MTIVRRVHLLIKKSFWGFLYLEDDMWLERHASPASGNDFEASVQPQCVTITFCC